MNITLIIITFVKILIVFGALLFCIAYSTLLERRVLAFMQDRYGPNRVGYFGLLQPLADGLKFIFKEDIIPKTANKILYNLAPAISLIPALIAFAVIPFGRDIEILGETVKMQIADLNVGILYIFAITSLGVYGTVVAGWSSNNKYSLLGGLRSSAQMISYELSLGLSIIGVLMITETLSMSGIVAAQSKMWNIVYQPLGFLIYLISGIAELNRGPFDLPEAESELVAGYHTEYSSMKFAMFFMAEYANMITVSAIATTMFLGGWNPPHPSLGFIPPVIWFLIKVFAFIYFMMWIRATFPRLRYDQLMRFGWKVLLPLALLNIVVTAAVMVFIR